MTDKGLKIRRYEEILWQAQVEPNPEIRKKLRDSYRTNIQVIDCIIYLKSLKRIIYAKD